MLRWRRALPLLLAVLASAATAADATCVVVVVVVVIRQKVQGVHGADKKKFVARSRSPPIRRKTPQNFYHLPLRHWLRS